jgi:glycine C-acetyltransferase
MDPIESLDKELGAEIEEIKAAGRYRFLRTIESEQGPVVRMGGREVLLFCSNNYLGLANHPRLKQAAIEAVERYGTSSVASRLVSGDMTLHQALEKTLARFKGTESALVFNCGYMANVGIISSIVGKGDLVVSDELNHASIIDGCRLSRAEVATFPHNNLEELESILKSHRYRRRLVVVDTVFSMDGDIAPLPRIAELCETHGAALMVDEAHAVGVLGTTGAGAVEHFGLAKKVPIQMGTLGKALGGFGAYAACSETVRAFLINRARSFIFTTALPPAVLAAAKEAVLLVQEEKGLREQLHKNIGTFTKGLVEMGYGDRVKIHGTAIVPLIIGPEELTMKMSQRLLEKGVFVAGIRPPTVPPGTCRLRITLMATHTEEQIAHALHVFEDLFAFRQMDTFASFPHFI